MSRTKKVNWMFLGLLLFYIAGSFGISYLNLKNPVPEVILDTLGEILIIIPIFLYLIVTKEKPEKLIQHEPMHPINYLFIIILAYLSMPLMSILNIFSTQVSENYVSDMLMNMMRNPFAYNLVIVAILPCLVEEFVFRGILFHSYREKGILKAAFVSGLLFGLLHLNLNQFSYGFVLGVIFALLVEATGTIWSSILFHFIVNTHSLILSTIFAYSPLFQNIEQELVGEQEADMLTEAILESSGYWIVSVAITILMAAGTTALGVMLYKYLAKRCGRWEHIKQVLKGQDKKSLLEENTEPKKKIFEILDIPLLLAIGICLFFLFYPLK